MKNFRIAATVLLLCLSLFTFAQQDPAGKIRVTGIVVEKVTKQPLEYATVTFYTADQKVAAGGITDQTGKYDISVAPGTYDVWFEFISFLPFDIKQRAFTADINLGTVSLAEDVTLLAEVEVRGEATTVDIKLDKKVYNVGQDLMVKGGTVSDVLDNIPSVSVDAEGTVSLRGNENVRILIDGRPTNAINIAEALRQIPADAIEKVEVVTNPSARYDSEGGGGLLNIILKKGKNQGINGTIIATVGDPENYGLSANINHKTEDFNLFATVGYNYRNNPGNSLTNTEYLNPDGSTDEFLDETRTNERLSKGFNSNLGMDWYLNKTTTWSNTLNLRRNEGENPDFVTRNSYDADHNFLGTTYRVNNQNNEGQNVEYSTNLTKNFNDKGHKLTVDGSFGINIDDDYSNINNGFETNSNEQRQHRNVLQADYVRPFGKDSQFEAGYKGEFNSLLADYRVDILNPDTNELETDLNFTNTLEYKEKINALYTQYGTKIDKFSLLFGLRWEDTNIDVNQLAQNSFNNKRYNNFFPSAFFTYEISDKSSASLSYSRRVSRPRGRMINPFQNRSSDINIFRGNPNLDASFTDAIDFGYLQRWTKLTLSTSLYVNRSTDSFQFIQQETGETVGGTRVLLTTPINLGTQQRYGFEFTLNYSPYKWWRLNSNFNFFRNETDGDYTYVNAQNVSVYQNFDNVATSWFTRLTSKVTLPYKIEWQTNFTYNGPQNTAQGRSLGVASANLAFSKDILKDNGTLSLNVQDVFNSRKRIYETNLPGLNSYTEQQWRQRQVNLSFTYRFNKKKSEREQQPQRNSGSEMEEFPG
ncbi:MAG TPA: TonB-dependent receptor [Flavobacterium sp.]